MFFDLDFKYKFIYAIFFSLTWRILLQADKKVALVSIVQIICIILNTISVVILINIFPDIHVVKLATAIIYLIQPITFNIYIEKHFDITKNVKPDKEAISQGGMDLELILQLSYIIIQI